MVLIEDTSAFLDETGNMANFTAHFISNGLLPKLEVKELLIQCYNGIHL